ncbi:hypothetical protein NPX13_g3878 [Xylaria arbuscula]|uniref:Uncharacterized protein n=1 Tax=Xylaria arbuscula TaxID=114810 RepID=A0A9W8NHF2_9PEZI|nr:hypothetical protein NPX13_g3878 [Xylaria arbuscula]
MIGAQRFSKWEESWNAVSNPWTTSRMRRSFQKEWIVAPCSRLRPGLEREGPYFILLAELLSIEPHSILGWITKCESRARNGHGSIVKSTVASTATLPSRLMLCLLPSLGATLKQRKQNQNNNATQAKEWTMTPGGSKVKRVDASLITLS